MAIPVNENKGLMSNVSHHFGKSEGFIIVNTDGSNATYLNTVSARVGDECAPIRTLKHNGCELICCYSMGRGAFVRCQDAGLKVLKLTMGESVGDVIIQMKHGALENFGKEALCSHGHHSHH